MFKSVQILFVLVLTLGFAACSPSGVDGSKMKEAPTSDFNTKSCAYDVTEGGHADFSALGTRDIVPMYFDKEINRAYLNAIAQASVDSSIQFVNQTGATVFKSAAINSTKCSKPLFSQGQNMFSDLGTVWTEATAGDSDDTGYTLGLFIPKGNYSDLPSLQNTAAIIVRENTNRWTLVHEFMHHLFYLRAVETGYNENQVRRDSNRALDDMQAISKIGFTAENLPAYAEAFSRYAKASDSRLVHFDLEEMTIESEMKDAETAGNLQFAPASTNFYIHAKGQTALKSLKSLQDFGDAVKNILGKSNPVELAMVESALATIESRRTVIMSLMDKYKYDLTSKEMNPGIYAEQVVQSGCSHGHEADLIISEIRNLPKIVRVLKK